eukprot:3511464-Pyramimonas_sp.AAC.1
MLFHHVKITLYVADCAPTKLSGALWLKGVGGAAQALQTYRAIRISFCKPSTALEPDPRLDKLLRKHGVDEK